MLRLDIGNIIRVSENLEETIYVCSYHCGSPAVLETRVFQLGDALFGAMSVAQVVRGTKSWRPVRSLLGRASSGNNTPTTRTAPCVEKHKEQVITREYNTFARSYSPGLNLEFIGQRSRQIYKQDRQEFSPLTTRRQMPCSITTPSRIIV